MSRLSSTLEAFSCYFSKVLPQGIYWHLTFATWPSDRSLGEHGLYGVVLCSGSHFLIRFLLNEDFRKLTVNAERTVSNSMNNHGEFAPVLE